MGRVPGPHIVNPFTGANHRNTVEDCYRAFRLRIVHVLGAPVTKCFRNETPATEGHHEALELANGITSIGVLVAKAPNTVPAPP